MGLVDEVRLYTHFDTAGVFSATDLARANQMAINSRIVGGEGSFSPSGLKTEGKITEVDLDDSSWTPIPATAQTKRNAIFLQNLSGSQIKLNFDNTEPGYVGWTVNDLGEFFIDVTDGIIIYGKAESGASPTITAMEVS